MEEVYRNIVGITEGIQLQASSLVKLARENLRLVTYSIPLLTSLLRKKKQSLGFLPSQLEGPLSRREDVFGKSHRRSTLYSSRGNKDYKSEPTTTRVEKPREKYLLPNPNQTRTDKLIQKRPQVPTSTPVKATLNN